MAFADSIKNLPFEAKQPNAKGILPPIIRAIGHIVFVAACVSDEKVAITNDEAKAELTHAKEHWDAIAAGNPNLSDASRTALVFFGITLGDALNEFDEWDDKGRVKNLKDLAQRAAALSAAFDREFIGILDSDPGLSL